MGLESLEMKKANFARVPVEEIAMINGTDPDANKFSDSFFFFR